VAQRIADFTPLGAGSQAMQQAWAGGWPSAMHLIVLAGSTAVLGTIAARSFRWE
jgi:ABC-2 type transport system permease protein